MEKIVCNNGTLEYYGWHNIHMYGEWEEGEIMMVSLNILNERE